MQRFRRVVCALAALSPRFLSGVLGRLSTTPPYVTYEDLWRFRSESDTLKLLAVAGFDPADLREDAEWLLRDAHSRDPLADWLPLVRHASYDGWSKLKGAALDCIWVRIGAEVLLRAHEDLAVSGDVEPLPNVAGAMWHSELDDRLGPVTDQASTLERVLGTFGLSPHPRVLLLVEGKTELYHVPRLLAEFGLTQPEKIRVQFCQGSDVNAQLLTRYGITPRLGKKIGDMQLLDRTPTALVIAMDPENKWKTAAQRDEERRKLQDAIREEVELQGGEIPQSDLDFLVNVRVWGDDKYELANFTPDELVPAITQLAVSQSNPRVSSPTWEQDLRAELEAAYKAHDDIKVPMGKMRIREDKVTLAKLLWPALLAKCETEVAAEKISTPVIKLAVEVRRLVSQLSAGSYAFSKP